MTRAWPCPGHPYAPLDDTQIRLVDELLDTHLPPLIGSAPDEYKALIRLLARHADGILVLTGLLAVQQGGPRLLTEALA